MKRSVAAAVLALCLSSWVWAADSIGGSDVSADVWAGLDAMSGDMTYEIGGKFKQNGVEERGHFPISRLEWPIALVSVQIGGRVSVKDWDFRAAFSAAQNDDAGKMKDSDWEIPDNPKVLTTYSESDSELKMWQAEASLRYWVPFKTSNPKEQARLGGGVGILYQSFDWSARDTDQWYPQNPELGHDRFAGEVITYKADVLMPYIEVGGQLKYQQLFFEARIGLAPWVQVEDVDDHKLRYIRAETTGDGAGAFGELLARYTFANNLFLQASLWAMTFETDGTEKDYVYGGEDAGSRWEIEHKVKSSQVRLTLAGGVTF